MLTKRGAIPCFPIFSYCEQKIFCQRGLWPNGPLIYVTGGDHRIRGASKTIQLGGEDRGKQMCSKLVLESMDGGARRNWERQGIPNGWTVWPSLTSSSFSLPLFFRIMSWIQRACVKAGCQPMVTSFPRLVLFLLANFWNSFQTLKTFQCLLL